jgi:hypothetical protein
MPGTRRKTAIERRSAAEIAEINRRNSRNSSWRRKPISERSAQCHEYFTKLAEAGDTRRVPRPELD